MHIENIRTYCLNLKGTNESFPFGEDVLVFKIIDKVYALCNLKEEGFINLKCDPDYAIKLREKYNFIIPGYHMNKTHWNTIYYNKCEDEKWLEKLILHSYELVFLKLNRKNKEILASLP